MTAPSGIITALTVPLTGATQRRANAGPESATAAQKAAAKTVFFITRSPFGLACEGAGQDKITPCEDNPMLNSYEFHTFNVAQAFSGA